MNGYQYILSRQTEWAKNRDLPLVGSRLERGRPIYTAQLEDNLFQPLLPEVRQSFSEGDGGELGSSIFPGKMQALHSSSALAVNVFQYWQSISAASEIASACGLCKIGSQVPCDIRFEEKYPVNDSFRKPPNLDVVIHNHPSAKIQRFAIESKYTEAYGNYEHGGLKQKYLDEATIWQDLPALRAFGERISPVDQEYKYLHPAQLVKHILGLKRRFGKQGFRLLYLWYDVLGQQGQEHQAEVETFAQVAKADGILFHSLTYQALIVTLAGRYRAGHGEYIRYLTGRYL